MNAYIVACTVSASFALYASVLGYAVHRMGTTRALHFGVTLNLFGFIFNSLEVVLSFFGAEMSDRTLAEVVAVQCVGGAWVSLVTHRQAIRSRGREVHLAERLLFAATLVSSALALVPGWGFSGPRIQGMFFGETATFFTTSLALGNLVLVLTFVHLVEISRHAIVLARQGANEGWLWVASFIAIIVCGIHDAIVQSQAHNIGEGLPASWTAAAAWFPGITLIAVISREAIRSRRQIDTLNSNLERLVAERTAALLAAEAELATAERLAAVGRVSAGIAHEVNNPIAAAMANLTFLRESLGDHDDEDVRSALADTDLALTRAAGIVRSMKMVVRASATDAPADLSSVALDAVIEQVLAEITAARGGPRLPVSLAGDPGLHVRADGARLGQIIANLVENALHASDGSPVVITRKAAGQRESRESLSSIVDVGSVELRISDQGPGMSPAVLARAREPFFSTKGPGEGTGLGLAVVDGLVHGLGGELAIDSRLGEGTEVRVTLPRGDAEREDVPDDSRLPRVLVVDDDPLVLRAISRTLSRVAEVTTADGVREALACLRGAEFDAIVSDVVMPEGGGQALYDALDPSQRRSVVFITAAAADPTVAAFLRGQERPVLEKPLDAEQLRQIVMQLGTSAPASVVRRRNDEIPGDTAATS